MTFTLFLIGSALLGIALARRLFGSLLGYAEQVFWGLVIGWMLTTCSAYLVARLAGRLSFAGVLCVMIAAWVAAVLLWLPALRAAREGRTRHGAWRLPVPSPSRRFEYGGLLLTLGLFAPVYLNLFRSRMLLAGAEGLYSGGSTWYDLGFHTALSNSFIYGNNFPPLYLPHPPAPLLYPFMPDFQTSALVVLGASMRSALIVTGVTLALAITGLFYYFALRVVRAMRAHVSSGSGEAGETADASSGRGEACEAAAAVLATALFLFNGGFGFVYFFKHWRESELSFADFWARLPANYANLGEKHIEWTNVVVDTFLPQRTALYGFPVALMLFTLFAALWQRWAEGGEAKSAWEGWRVLLPAGALAGLLLLFHSHTFIAVGLLSVALFLARPRRAWVAFWLPAVLVAAPHLVSLKSHVTGEGFIRFQLGWHAHAGVSWPLFWLLNIGLPTLLILPAWMAAPPVWRRFYLAFVALLCFSLLVVVSPSSYDNIKLIYYWYAASAVLIGAWLVRLACAHRQRFLAFLLAFLLGFVSIFSGLLAVRFEAQSRRLFLDREQLAAADFVRAQTAPRALFLTAPTLHQPVLSLAGRPVLHGFVTWPWSHGYDFAERDADVKTIYAGARAAVELLRYYGVEYVYFGAAEETQPGANRAFFDATFPAVYRSGRVTIYDVRAATAASATDAAPAARDAAPPARDAAPPVRDAVARLRALPPREFAARLDEDPHQLLVEFPRAAYAVYRYYKVAYGRAPTLEEMMAGAKVVGRGVHVSAPGWRETLEANKGALTNSMVAGQSFKSLHDARTNAEYVESLYVNIGVRPPSSERDSLIALLNAGAEDRASILRRVAENRRLYRNEYNRAYVLAHFFGYLRNDPNAPGQDLKEFNSRLDALNRTRDYRGLTHDFVRLTMHMTHR